MFIAVGDEGGQGVHVSMLDHRDLIRLKERMREDQVQTLYKDRKSKQTLKSALFASVRISIAYT